MAQYPKFVTIKTLAKKRLIKYLWELCRGKIGIIFDLQNR